MPKPSMNKLPPMALLCAGPVSRSELTRLPNLRRHLSWVKSTSFQVASRAVNALRAGTPVASIAEVRRAGIWVVSVPKEELPDALEELDDAGLDWRRKVLLLLEADVESSVADAFRQAGAAVATFAPVDSEGTRYCAEGDPDAIRVVQALVHEPRSKRLLEIKKGAKAEYLAGAHAATKKVLPLIAEAVECFQKAGLTLTEAKGLTEMLLAGAMRSYCRAGRRAIKS